ncbi:unnamed protein product [Amoebophrya sp. A25]|nr:unnamed protein product [Amoebophrya sp. A25]|eukprot:GSA25T00026261001.1
MPPNNRYRVRGPRNPYRCASLSVTAWSSALCGLAWTSHLVTTASAINHLALTSFAAINEEEWQKRYLQVSTGAAGVTRSPQQDVHQDVATSPSSTSSSFGASLSSVLFRKPNKGGTAFLQRSTQSQQTQTESSGSAVLKKASTASVKASPLTPSSNTSALTTVYTTPFSGYFDPLLQTNYVDPATGGQKAIWKWYPSVDQAEGTQYCSGDLLKHANGTVAWIERNEPSCIAATRFKGGPPACRFDFAKQKCRPIPSSCINRQATYACSVWAHCAVDTLTNACVINRDLRSMDSMELKAEAYRAKAIALRDSAYALQGLTPSGIPINAVPPQQYLPLQNQDKRKTGVQMVYNQEDAKKQVVVPTR